MRARAWSTRTTAGLTAIALTAGATGCGSGDVDTATGAAQADALKTIQMINPAPGQPAWDTIARCFQDEAKAKGLTAKVSGPSGASAYDVPALLERTQQAIAGGADAISLTTSFSAPSFDAVLAEAKAKGVLVGTLESGDATKSRDFDVGIDILKFARDSVAEARRIPGAQQIGLLVTGLSGTPKAFADEVKAEVAKGSGLELVGTVTDDADATKSAGAVAGLLKSHPDIDVVISANPTATAGAATAIREADAIGKTRLIGLTRDDAANAALASGAAHAFYVQHLCDVGRFTVDRFAARAAGKPVDALVPVDTAFATKQTTGDYDEDWG